MGQGLLPRQLSQGLLALAGLGAGAVAGPGVTGAGTAMLTTAAASAATAAAAATAPAVALLGLASTPAAHAASTAPSPFQKRFQPLYTTVFAEGGRFSGSAMSADLETLEPYLQQLRASKREIFLFYYTQATVYGRRNLAAPAAKATAKALATIPQTSDPELAYAHFFLRYSSIRWLADSQQYEEALEQIQAFQKQYPLWQVANLPLEMRWEKRGNDTQAYDYPTQLQMLGVYEDAGYVLHEQGRYREARQANETLLPFAQQRLQALGMPERLRGLLSNLAQNCYELGDFQQAGKYLQQRLDIAYKAGDSATVYDSYFQLMVLAHEQKHSQQAQHWLAAYETYATAQKNSEQLARAKELRADLARMPTARKTPSAP